MVFRVRGSVGYLSFGASAGDVGDVVGSVSPYLTNVEIESDWSMTFLTSLRLYFKG